MARSQPSADRAPASSGTSSRRPTPISWRAAPAGLARGPITLKIVRTPSSRRTPASSFIAGWKAGENRKTIPAWSSTRPAPAASRPRCTPLDSSTSAEPTRDETERLPCLATAAPAPAATIAAAVEMLKRFLPSPPVPHVSSRGDRPVATRRIRRRRADTAPAISSAVSPRAASPSSSAPFWASVARPSMRSPKASSASERESGSRAAASRSASATDGVIRAPGGSSRAASLHPASAPTPGGTGRRRPASSGAPGPSRGRRRSAP